MSFNYDSGKVRKNWGTARDWFNQTIRKQTPAPPPTPAPNEPQVTVETTTTIDEDA